MKNEEILKKIKSVKLCLTAHPDFESGSEFEDRVNDLIAIEYELAPIENPKVGVKRVLNGHQVWFEIGVQTFFLEAFEGKNSFATAKFFEKMLNVAFEKI